jgi:hypothetical protein
VELALNLGSSGCAGAWVPSSVQMHRGTGAVKLWPAVCCQNHSNSFQVSVLVLQESSDSGLLVNSIDFSNCSHVSRVFESRMLKRKFGTLNLRWRK